MQVSLPHDSTRLEPHEVLFGFPMPMPFDWKVRTKDFADYTPREQRNWQEAQEAAKRIQGYVDYAWEMILRAQQKQAEQANRHRRVPDFDVGDHVVILKQSETTNRPSDKLSYPVTQQHYKIAEKTATGAYRLEVPESGRGTTVFTADRLRKYPNNRCQGKRRKTQPENKCNRVKKRNGRSTGSWRAVRTTANCSTRCNGVAGNPTPSGTRRATSRTPRPRSNASTTNTLTALGPRCD